MKWVYQWVGDILFFLIFLNLIRTVLPSKKYETYIRFFGGLTLILLVIRPIPGVSGLERSLAGAMERLEVRTEAKELRRQILGIENRQKEQLLKGYEQEIEQDLKSMIIDAGLEVVTAEASIERDEAKENYGGISHIRLVVRSGEEKREEDFREVSGEVSVEVSGGVYGEIELPGESAGGSSGGTAVDMTEIVPVQIDRVQIRPVQKDEHGTEEASGESRSGQAAETVGGDWNDRAAETAGGNEGESSGSAGGGWNSQAAKSAGDFRIRQLRRKVEEYYELESEDLEIQLEE